jgi:hypothetical protein
MLMGSTARDHPTFHRVKGRFKWMLGWLTADRHAEAEGVAEMRTRRQPDEGLVVRAEHEVKVKYGEASEEPPTST